MLIPEQEQQEQLMQKHLPQLLQLVIVSARTLPVIMTTIAFGFVFLIFSSA
jgi:hypothetical protein